MSFWNEGHQTLTYDQFKVMYETHVKALIDAPKSTTNLISSPEACKAASLLADLTEAYPEFEKRYDDELDSGSDSASYQSH